MVEMQEQSLPCNLEAERYVLGSILLNDSQYALAAGSLSTDDYHLEAHRRTFDAMAAIQHAGKRIDRVTVANELLGRGQLESVGGLSYLVSLDDGLPQIVNLEEYIRIVRDRSTLRKICFAANSLMAEALPGNREPDEILARASREFLALAERGASTTLRTPLEIIDQAGGMSAYLDRSRTQSGIPTGYSGIDAVLGGWRPGALYVIGGRPSMGKTALAMNFAEHAAVKGHEKVLIFSLEMDAESLLDRMICSRARVHTKRFESGVLDSGERQRIAEAAAEIACEFVDGQIADGDKLRIDDRAVTGIHEIHSKIQKQQARTPIGLVVVDYLQLMEGKGNKSSNRTEEVGGLSRGMKLIAKDCGVPVILLSQLSRDVDKRPDHRPILSDLRESGSIEQDADVVGFVYREQVYSPDNHDLDGKADLIIAKQRGGPIGTVPLVWLKEFVRFESRAMEDS